MIINLTADEKQTLSHLQHEYASCDILLKTLEEKLETLKKEKQFILDKILFTATHKEKDFLDSLKDKYGIGELDIENCTYHVK